jgi:hypothetical protein
MTTRNSTTRTRREVCVYTDPKKERKSVFLFSLKSRVQRAQDNLKEIHTHLLYVRVRTFSVSKQILQLSLPRNTSSSSPVAVS